MLYNLSNKIDQERFKRRSNELYKSGEIVDLTAKKPRTPSQNKYLHLIINYLALETSNTAEYVKRIYFKITCNYELFVITKEDKILKTERKELRSSRDLTTSEMTLAIEKFRDWSAKVAGVYLPEPGEQEFLTAIECEIDKHKQYL